jgi:hypothetical protein
MFGLRRVVIFGKACIFQRKLLRPGAPEGNTISHAIQA